MKKSGTTTLKNLIISDPCYQDDVWCRYKTQNDFSGWQAVAKARDVIFKYKESDIPIVDASVVLAVDKEQLDKLTKGKLGAKKRGYVVKSYTIGLDTASVYFGNINHFGEYTSFHTGADGCFGEVVEYYQNNKLVGVVFLCSADRDFTNAKEFINLLIAGFEIQ